MKKILIAAISSTLVTSSAFAGGLVPGSEAGIESHETAERLAIAEGGHIPANSVDHTIFSHPPQTFGYSIPRAGVSNHNIIPGSEYGVERLEETRRDQVQSGDFANAETFAHTSLGWDFLVPGSEYGLR